MSLYINVMDAAKGDCDKIIYDSPETAGSRIHSRHRANPDPNDSDCNMWNSSIKEITIFVRRNMTKFIFNNNITAHNTYKFFVDKLL